MQKLMESAIERVSEAYAAFLDPTLDRAKYSDDGYWLDLHAVVPDVPNLKENFKLTCKEELRKALGEGSVMLSTDYGPEGLLYKVCQQTGVPGNIFPYKSSCLILGEKKNYQVISSMKGPPP